MTKRSESSADDSDDHHAGLRSGAQAASVAAGGVAVPATAGGSPASALVAGPASISAVWAYFDKDALGNAVCKFCDRVIKGHHSSNLLSHLRTAGRTDPAHQQANNVCEEHRENKRHLKRQKLAPAVAHAPHESAAAFHAHPQAAAGNNAAMAALQIKRDGSNSGLYPSTMSTMAAMAVLSKEQRDGFGFQPIALSQDQLVQELGSCGLCLLCGWRR